MAYRIIEKEYSTGRKEYIVETNRPRWWSKKRKWRVDKHEVICWDMTHKEPCIFNNLKDAHDYIARTTERPFNERLIKEYNLD